MYKLHLNQLLLFLIILLQIGPSAYGQDNDNDSSIVDFSLRYSIGPALVAVDPGYFLLNELNLEFSKRFTLSFAIGAGNATGGIRDLMKTYFPQPELSDIDYARQQSFLSVGAGMQLAIVNSAKNRLYLGVGPGLTFYNYSEGSVKPYGEITVYQIQSRQANTLSLNYFLGYERTLQEHLLLGFTFHGSQFTEFMHSILFTVGYRL